MNVIDRYKGKRKAGKLGLPYTIDKLWLAGCYAFGNKESGRKVHMPYFTNRKYVEYKVGDIVPVFKKKDGVGYYKIINWVKYSGSDPAMFDDQKKYDLLFDHFSPHN